MANPRKFYLVDSENVNDLWVNLLDQLQGNDQIIVFYTSNSPHMCLDKVIRLMQTKRSYIHWIRCFEGNNALDFQLVTQLGTMIAKSPKASYLIVSNDTGFDAAVKYWKRAGINIKRMRGVECKMKDPDLAVATANGNEKTENKEAHRSELSLTANPKNERKGKSEKSDRLEKTEKLGRIEKSIKTEKTEHNDETAIPEKAESPSHTLVSPETSSAPEMSETQTTTVEPANDTPLLAIAPPKEPLLSPPPSPIPAVESQTEVVAWPDTISTPENISHEEPPTSEETVPEVTTDATLLNFLDDAHQAESVYRLSQSVSMSNLATLRATLSHIFGRETGNIIYRQLREHPEETKALKANYLDDRNDRRKQYFLLLLDLAQADTKHVDALLAICAQATKEDLPKLNTTIQKTFEKENWATYYKIVKRNIQILQNL